VITRSEKLIGERGAVVRGGIVIRASHVTVRNVAVLGGENGIDVEGAHNVVLEGVRVVGARMDGIHVRTSEVMIRDCVVDSAGGIAQGIDISFALGMGMSMVEGCTVTGGQEGIVIDSAEAVVSGNRVAATSMRGITMNEMSMGMIEHNQVAGALGIGILCGDQSECMIEKNRVSGTRADHASGDLSRMGYGIVSHFRSNAEVSENELVGNAHGMGAFASSEITHR
jgi:nitrous oxidase accessory protein NosD